MFYNALETEDKIAMIVVVVRGSFAELLAWFKVFFCIVVKLVIIQALS